MTWDESMKTVSLAFLRTGLLIPETVLDIQQVLTKYVGMMDEG